MKFSDLDPTPPAPDYAKTRKKLETRADFQPVTARPGVAYAKTQRETHLDKMYRYREQILALLQDTLAQSLFERLDIRSMDKILSEEPNTAISVFSDLLNYLKVCHTYNVRGFPVDDSALEFYLNYVNALPTTHEKGQNKRPKLATVERRMASLAKWHQWLELDDFRKTYRAADRLKKAHKDHRGPQRQAEGLMAAHLFQAQKVFNPKILRDCVDIALLFTGFYTLCRRSELASFDWANLKENATDKSGLLHLRESKTDKKAEGQYLYVSPLTMGILKHWQKVSGQRTGKIFRAVYSNGELGEYLSDKGIARAYQRIARRLGLDYTCFSGHSSRVGAAQEMVGRDISTAKIMLAGRWKSERMVVRYARELEASRGAAADLATLLEGKPDTQRKTDHLENNADNFSGVLARIRES